MDIFEYLDVVRLYKAFCGHNQRFNDILYDQRLRLHFDTLVMNENFDFDFDYCYLILQIVSLNMVLNNTSGRRLLSLCTSEYSSLLQHLTISDDCSLNDLVQLLQKTQIRYVHVRRLTIGKTAISMPIVHLEYLEHLKLNNVNHSFKAIEQLLKIIPALKTFKITNINPIEYSVQNNCAVLNDDDLEEFISDKNWLKRNFEIFVTSRNDGIYAIVHGKKKYQ
ncbi:unnamed protein product [Didymodactylos carnosus]|uniref:Uncharacterized protein n=1 Tax=Didymodactylos carnosus TaxID=1234261 RepID=A0A8S2FDZ3_9BILA|nr:unnamed protein product [Didymodactylos carnosus]CAF4227420.1 unnamed protein product [Didymodactylos carnosus]